MPPTYLGPTEASGGRIDCPLWPARSPSAAALHPQWPDAVPPPPHQGTVLFSITTSLLIKHSIKETFSPLPLTLLNCEDRISVSGVKCFKKKIFCFLTLIVFPLSHIFEKLMNLTVSS